MRLPQLFGIGTASRSRAVTPASLVNVYLENRPVGEKAETVAYGIPGLELLSDPGETTWRGLISLETDAYFYGVHRGNFHQIDNNGVRTARGMLNTVEGRVGMAHNGTTILIVDGTSGYTYDIATTTLTEITDGDFLAGAKTATWLNQLFVVEDGTSFATSPDGSSWTSTDVSVPESSPDGIQRVIADHGELVILGGVTTEFWVGVGSADFAFAPLKSDTAEWGCVAPWSVCKTNDTLAFVAKNSDGQASVVRLSGHVPQPISTPDIDHILNSFSSLTNATALAFKVGGHPFYQLNLPSGDRSFLFDALTNRWTSVKSHGMGRHRNDQSIQYLNRTIIADGVTGHLYRLNSEVYTENGATIEAELISDVIRSPDGERFPVDCLRLDMETGVGDFGSGSDPQVMLQVSRDGGYSWGAEMWRPAGKKGQYARRVEWRRLGSSAQWSFKVRMADPVKRVFVSASINPRD